MPDAMGLGLSFALGEGPKFERTVREEAEGLPAAARDAQRVKGVLADRHTRSQQFFASSAAQWDKVRAELFGTRTELFALV
ncbi:MAG TPA: hypothetical protein PK788_04845, partial [Gemmatimonadaceae bacterium]|nr:hypothetical protein [Gemmatimonadaceae bacterium]